MSPEPTRDAESVADAILRKIVNAGGYIDLNDGVIDVAVSLTDEEIVYVEALLNGPEEAT